MLERYKHEKSTEVLLYTDRIKESRYQPSLSHAVFPKMTCGVRAADCSSIHSCDSASFLFGTPALLTAALARWRSHACHRQHRFFEKMVRYPSRNAVAPVLQAAAPQV